jgi:hypothetical protein
MQWIEAKREGGVDMLGVWVCVCVCVFTSKLAVFVHYDCPEF